MSTGREPVWSATLPDGAVRRRPGLDCDTDADVCVVGGGFTGLWAAYHLLRADPSLRVCRRRGWCAGTVWTPHGRCAAP